MNLNLYDNKRVVVISEKEDNMIKSLKKSKNKNNEYKKSLETNIHKINTSNIISPYKPLRRGFLGLYKLVPQRAIAIPVGVRMHFITTSKDIIHS